MRVRPAIVGFALSCGLRAAREGQSAVGPWLCLQGLLSRLRWKKAARPSIDAKCLWDFRLMAGPMALDVSVESRVDGALARTF